MTNSWTDIQNTDLVIIMGGNAAEAHPCGFKWVTEAKANRGAKLIVVDPRFTRSAAVSDFYAPIRQGTDIAFLLGVINYCMQNGKVQWEYVKAFTNAPYLVKEGFGYADGLFTGYEEARRDYNRSTWEYELGPDGYVISDDTLENPRCVWQLLKKHASIYTPEMVERICGTPKAKFLKICEMIGECSSKTKTMTSMYALGWTQHSKGSQNIRTMAMLQLILGNIGVRGGGMNALRGHSNIQGLTDLGLMSNLLPGYLTIPTEKEPTLDAYLSTRGFKPLRPDQTSYWQNYKKFFISFQKAMWGAAATRRQQLRLRLAAEARCAGLRRSAHFRVDVRRQNERLFLPGLQSAAVLPQSPQADHGALEAEVPGDHGSARDRDGAFLGESRRAQ